MSSSSNFYVDDNGKLHNHKHVINPASGCPVEEFTSVSVKTTSPVQSEILSTAALVSSNKSIMKLKEKLDGVEIIKINYQSGTPELQVF
ncbi:MAG: FAD:protein FMN transferase [Balneolaceae bacterium]